MVLDTIFVSFFRVYQLLGEAGTYYGVRFGKNIPWVTEFPFGYIKDPQYVGSILSLLACLCWVPFQYIFLWILGYVFMIWVESTEDPTTRAKPLNWFISQGIQEAHFSDIGAISFQFFLLGWTICILLWDLWTWS